MGEAERGESAPRVRVSFWCSNNHETRPSFASDAAVPETWDCPRCGFPAGRDQANPPGPPRSEPYKTHLAYVKERRSDSDGAAILAEESFAERTQPRIAERPRSLADVIPIHRLFRAKIRRSLQQLRTFLAVEMPHFPIPSVEPELLVLHKLA